MPKFKYIAMDAKGREKSGTLEADNQARAITVIKEQGLFPTNVVEVGGGRKADAGGSTAARPARRGKAKKGGLLHMELKIPGLNFLGGGIKAKLLMVFTRQLATLIDAGLPLLRGITILRKQEKNRVLLGALDEMHDAIESGSSFAEALAQQPKVFNKLFINMVKAGEVGGMLDVVLLRLAVFMEKAERIKNKVKGAMIYPAVVMAITVGILVLLLKLVIPKFKDVFEDLLEGAPLPPLTQFVIDASDAFQAHWLAIIIIVVLIVFGLMGFRRTKFGARLTDRLSLSAPLFGSLLRRHAIARLTRTLGTLLNAGVPVLQALNIVRETAGNEIIGDAIMTVHDSVKEGESMAMPLEASKLFPGMVVSMIDIGEETGQLPDMLLKIADTYDDEVDTAVEGLTAVIEPIMIVMLAVVVGTIVIAMFMPMITIMEKM